MSLAEERAHSGPHEVTLAVRIFVPTSCSEGPTEHEEGGPVGRDEPGNRRVGLAVVPAEDDEHGAADDHSAADSNEDDAGRRCILMQDGACPTLVVSHLTRIEASSLSVLRRGKVLDKHPQ